MRQFFIGLLVVVVCAFAIAIIWALLEGLFWVFTGHFAAHPFWTLVAAAVLYGSAHLKDSRKKK